MVETPVSSRPQPKFPLPIQLVSQEEFLGSGDFGTRSYWLTSHRLILSGGPLLIVSLIAIGSLAITRRTFPWRWVLGWLLAAVTLGLVLWIRQRFAQGASPNFLIGGAALSGILSVIAFSSAGGYRVVQVTSHGGTPIAIIKITGWQRHPVDQIVAQISDAMAQIAPKSRSCQGEEAQRV